MTIYEGNFTGASDLKIGIVVARFNDLITNKILSGCLDCLKRHGLDTSKTSKDVDIVWVPGSFELPIASKRLLKKTSYDVFVSINPKSSENSLRDKRFSNANIIINRIYDRNKPTNCINKRCSSNWYELTRYKYCIPEGTEEIESNATLPLEINLDLLGGISFEKGCFVGQEVNARIKYKGLVKRKYVSVHFKNKNSSFSNLDKIDNRIFLKTQDIGQVIALSLDKEDDIWYGIAKIKLSQLYLFEENFRLDCDFCGSKVKINFPKYMLPLPRKI